MTHLGDIFIVRDYELELIIAQQHEAAQQYFRLGCEGVRVVRGTGLRAWSWRASG